MEFELDLAVLEVCFETLAEFLGAYVAARFGFDPFALAAQFGGVFGAGRRDHCFVFFDAPGEFAQAPAGLRVVALGGDARHAALDREAAEGVHDGRQGDVQGQVCRGEDADGVLVVARAQGAADRQVAAELCFDAVGGFGADVQGVVDCADLAVDGGGQVARDEVGEGQFLHSFGEFEGFGVVAEEVPFVEVGDLTGAFAAAVGDGFFGGHCCFEEHDDALHDDVAG